MPVRLCLGHVQILYQRALGTVNQPDLFHLLLQPDVLILQPQQPAPHISNYLAWAIVCIFLCWPLAIPAIVYASKVNNLIAMGDYEGAMNASKNAKTFCIIATVLGAIAIVLGIIGGIIGGMAASSYYYYY